MSPTRLEDLRGLHVGDGVLLVANRPLGMLAFHDHANQAHAHTLNCLLRLAGHSIDGRANPTIGVVEWWRTVESLIALLHVVAITESEVGLRPALQRLTTSNRVQILTKWQAIVSWFSNGNQSPPSQITGRLVELRDFRNSFEHSSRGTEITVRHSRLSSWPGTANVADLFEAMAICIQTCDFIRYALVNCDLMPEVVVPSRKHVFFEKIDVLASELLWPTYLEVVRSLGLTTDVALYPTAARLAGASDLPAAFAVKAAPDGADVASANPLGIWEHFEGFASSHKLVPGPDEFRLPGYMRMP